MMRWGLVGLDWSAGYKEIRKVVVETCESPHRQLTKGKGSPT